jgi:hypothetical protein
MPEMGKDLNRHWPKAEIEMDYRYRKRCPTSLTIGERQIKPVLRKHFEPVRMAIIQKTKGGNTLVHPLWETCRGAPQN